MKSLRMLLAGLLLASGFSTMDAFGQPEEEKKGRQVRPGGPDGGRLDRAGRNRARRARGAEAQLAQLSEGLNLDDAQKAEIGELLKAHESKMREMRDSFRPTPEEMEEMEAIREAMREARESDDREKMAEIRERMQATRAARNERMGPAREAIASAESKLHDDILGKLNDDQKASFDKIWSQVMAPRGADRGGKYDPRLLQRAVSRAKGLTSEQESQIEKLFADYRENARTSRKDRGKKPESAGDDEPGDGQNKDAKDGRRPRRGARDDAAGKKLYEDVMAVLTPEQKKEVEETLKRAGGKRGERGERPDRDARRGPGRFGDGPKSPTDEPTDD